MFKGATSFNRVISKWDVSKVTAMMTSRVRVRVRVKVKVREEGHWGGRSVAS